MATTTDSVDGTELAYRTAGPDAPQLEDAGAAVRLLREQRTRTRLDVLPGRGHGDVLAARPEILAGAHRCHAAPGGARDGAPGGKTVP